MQALVLIGGRGTRLRPLTPATPKPLIPVVNRPFLQYQLDVLRGHVSEVILTAGDLRPFKAALGGRYRGMKLTYAAEPEPMGTGGAVKQAARLLDGRRDFLVLNGDILHNLDISAFMKTHRRLKRLATVALTRVADPTMYGLVRLGKAGAISEFVEKPSADEVDTNLVNAGAYMFSPQALDRFETSLERSVFPRLIGLGQLSGFESHGYWMDIGQLDRYLQVHLDLLGGRTGLPIGRPRPTIDGGRAVIDASAKLDGTVRLSGNVSVAQRCSVAAGALLQDCVVLEGTRVGANARIVRSVIGPRCRVGEGAALVDVAALAGGSRVESYSRL